MDLDSESVKNTSSNVIDTTNQYYDIGNLTQQELCEFKSSLEVVREPGTKYCEAMYNGLVCFISTKANTTASGTCPPLLNAPGHILSFRFCQENGEWNNETDYINCINYLDSLPHTMTTVDPEKIEDDQYQTQIAIIMRDIYFVCSIISLFFLLITLFVFCYFRSLQCNRVSIHKHLVVSFILRFVVIIVMIEPVVFDHVEYSYLNVEWLCKVIQTLSQYTLVSNIYWMFVEGLFLHSSIAFSVFSTEAPFKVFCCIGWGFPVLVATGWSIAMHFTNSASCWDYHSENPYNYIVIGAILLALVVNLFFLVNIIRILVTKLRANNTHESSRIKKAIKATVVLMPLLGLTNLIFLWNPRDGGSIQIAYHVTNAVLHSSQGIFISLFYCILNGEVRRVIKQKYNRFKIQRILKNKGRRRSSRTSSFVMSQTENNGQSSSTESNADVPHTYNNNNRYQKVDLITEVRDETVLDNEKSEDIVEIETKQNNINTALSKLSSGRRDSKPSVTFRLDKTDTNYVKRNSTESTGKSVDSHKSGSNGDVDGVGNSSIENDSPSSEYSSNEVEASTSSDIESNSDNNEKTTYNNRLSIVSSEEFKSNLVGDLTDEMADEFMRLLRSEVTTYEQLNKTGF